jgi:hypothetical protein
VVAGVATGISGSSFSSSSSMASSPSSFSSSCDVADAPEGPWVTEFDPIGDLEFEWGHVYHVELGSSDRAADIVDAPRFAKFVTKVLSDQPVDPDTSTFEVLVDPTDSPRTRPSRKEAAGGI